MDRQFVFLNFHTEYSSTGTLQKEMCREYCFSDVFYGNSKQGNTYVIKFYMGQVGLKDGAKNNACFLTKEQLNDHIELARKIHDFRFEIREDPDNKDVLDVEIELHATRITHRYILTWIRYAYEYPFNMYLMDAMKLKELDEFKDIDLFNLFTLVGATSGYHFHGDRIHSIGDISWPRKFYTLEERIAAVKKAPDNGEVNDLFPKIDINITTIFDNNENFRKNYECLEYWEDDNYFNERLSYYRKTKDKIINYKD